MVDWLTKRGRWTTDNRFARSIQELDRVLATVDDFCAQCGAGDKTTFAVLLVAEELFTNFVKFNRGGTDHILMNLDCTGEMVSLTLTDYEVDPFDVTQIPAVDVTVPADQRTPGGLGLHLVKAYTDGFQYEYTDRAMKVTATKRLEAGDV